MKAAIIGSGLQCRRRAPVIFNDQDVTLAIIAGTEERNANHIAVQYGAKFTLDWREILDDSSIDLVLVCTPPHLHAEMTIACLESGKHVLCEKPLCSTLEEADFMLAAAKKNCKVLKCGFNHRHHPLSMHMG